MTESEKAKAYDKAINRASGFRTQELKDVAAYIFPELAESEDEKIRKEILDYIKHIEAQTIPEKQYDSWIAWLEKQGGLKPVIIPKFRVGDVIKESGISTTYKVVRLIDNGIAFVDDKGEEYTKYYDEDDWDSYELVEQKPVEEIKGNNGGISTNSEWSEEDEEMLDFAITVITTSTATTFKKEDCVDWLKSLSPQKQWKPTEEHLKGLLWVRQNIPYCLEKEWLSNLLEQLKAL